MNFAIRELDRDEDFDPSSICVGVPFTQAGFYGDWQKSLGRTVKRFVVEKEGSPVAYFQVIKYPLLLGKNYLYIPYGPVTKDRSESFFNFLKQELKAITKKENAVFVRLDFTPKIENSILKKYFTKSPLCTYHSAYFQPRQEWFLGLKPTEAELIEAMHENTSYSIRTAEKREMISEIVTDDFEQYFEAFHELMTITATRNGFNLHQREYYEGVFHGLSKDNCFLSVARFGEKILVVDVFIVFGGVANYVFGCSSNEERKRMPAYSAQWKAIRHAKSIGCTDYNFGGIATDSKIYKGWEGLTSFKKKFGGYAVDHSDFFDVIANPFWYYLYSLRKLVKKWGL
ncbi:MAG: peptidoglycan bridge formation glycyltransferase FemA/FemB family protein [bacterium]